MKEKKQKAKKKTGSSSWLIVIILFLSIAMSYFVFWHSNLLLQYPIAIIGVASVFVAAAGVIYSKEKEWQIKQEEIKHEKEIKKEEWIIKRQEMEQEKELDTINFQREKKEEFYLTLNLFDRALDNLITATEIYHCSRIRYGDAINMIKKAKREEIRRVKEGFDKLDRDISEYDQERSFRKDQFDQLLSKLMVLQNTHQFLDRNIYDILMTHIAEAVEKSLYEIDSIEQLDDATQSSRKQIKIIHNIIIGLTTNIATT